MQSINNRCATDVTAVIKLYYITLTALRHSVERACECGHTSELAEETESDDIAPSSSFPSPSPFSFLSRKKASSSSSPSCSSPFPAPSLHPCPAFHGLLPLCPPFQSSRAE